MSGGGAFCFRIFSWWSIRLPSFMNSHTSQMAFSV